MNIQRLKYFVSLAENLNFTKAANECFIVQTAMSRQIAALEDELGVLLFKRDTRSVELTDAGKEFYWHALKIISYYSQAIERVNLVAQKHDWSLRIGIGPYEHILLSPILKEFVKRYPEALLYCQQFSYDKLAKGFAEGNYDVILCINHCAARVRGCESLVIYDDSWGIMCSELNPLARKETITYNDLNGQTLVNMSEYNIDEYKRDTLSNFTPSKFIHVNTYAAKLLFTRANIGVAWVPEFIAPLLPSDLKYFALKAMHHRDFRCAYIPERLSNPALEAFLNVAGEKARTYLSPENKGEWKNKNIIEVQ